MKDCADCAIRSKAVNTLTNEEFTIHRNNCAELELNPGESIFKQGQLSSHIAYLKSGLAKIHKKGVKNKDQILKIVKPSRYIGLQSIISTKVHLYSATVLVPSRVCYVDTNTFKELITRNANFANELLLYLCEDEMSYFDRVVNIHQKQVNGRLADSILFFSKEISKSNEFIIPLSRSDIAALVCSTRESVIRSLKELSEVGAIKVKGKKIEILNNSLLESISSKG